MKKPLSWPGNGAVVFGGFSLEEIEKIPEDEKKAIYEMLLEASRYAAPFIIGTDEPICGPIPPAATRTAKGKQRRCSRKNR